MAVNVKLTPEQQKYIAAAVLILGGGGFAYVRYFWLPVSEKIAETTRQIEEVEGKISKAKGQAQGIQCLNNIKQTQLAAILYPDDYNNTISY